MRPIYQFLTLTLATSLFLSVRPARAQNPPGNGFQVSRYQPTAAGEWSFWVDRPWYSSTRLFAAGFTFDYGNNPLILGLTNSDGSALSESQAVIAHQFIGHLDLAVSFAERVNLSFTLPVTLMETGTDQPLGGVLPQGAGAGDPRLGAMVRLYGQADESPFSIHLGTQVFFPLHTQDDPSPSTRSDQELRLLAKLVLAGYSHRVRWAFTSGLLYRPLVQLGSPDQAGVTAGSEMQIGASIYYADKQRRFSVGPEAVLATLISPNRRFQ